VSAPPAPPAPPAEADLPAELSQADLDKLFGVDEPSPSADDDDQSLDDIRALFASGDAEGQDEAQFDGFFGDEEEEKKEEKDLSVPANLEEDEIFQLFQSRAAQISAAKEVEKQKAKGPVFVLMDSFSMEEIDKLHPDTMSVYSVASALKGLYDIFPNSLVLDGLPIKYGDDKTKKLKAMVMAVDAGEMDADEAVTIDSRNLRKMAKTSRRN